MSPSQTITAKRGYLANLDNIPPLVYPFQFNPTELTDSKDITWGKGIPISLLSPLAAVSGATQFTARLFSKAVFRRFESEGDRILKFKLTLDGREQRPGEPKQRRNAQGDILADLAILRSFVYPALASISDLVTLVSSGSPDPYSPQPPTVLLVMGDLLVEGFITNLEITETLFNADLNPMRADVSISMIEKIDSLAFAADSIKRFSQSAANTASQDISRIF